MKKAKIILSAIGLLSVIGGTLAFKAQRTVAATHFCTKQAGAICNLFAYTTVKGVNNSWYCSTIANRCTVLFTKVTLNV